MLNRYALLNKMLRTIKNRTYEFIKKCFHWLKNSVNFWLILANIILATFAILSYRHGISVHEAIDRPYLEFINSSQELTEVAKAKKTISHQKFETFLINEGNRPAMFDASNIKYEGYPTVVWEPEEPTAGVIFPNQKIRLSWIVYWNEETAQYLKWVREEMDPVTWCIVCNIELTVRYGLLGTNSTSSYFTTLQSSHSRTPDGRIGKSEFSFSIKDAR